jgi:hypothetical protein
VSTLVTNLVQLGLAGGSGNISYDATNTEIDFSAAGNFSGNVTATYFVGDGSELTGISAGGSITVGDDTSTDANTFFLLLSPNVTSGSLSTVNTSSTQLFFNASTGVLTATDFDSLSDESLKINVNVISNALNTVRQIEGVDFQWAASGKKSSGFVAQQLETAIPHLVTTNETGMKTVNYNGVIAYLVQTVKELDARVKELESKNGI